MLMSADLPDDEWFGGGNSRRKAKVMESLCISTVDIARNRASCFAGVLIQFCIVTFL